MSEPTETTTCAAPPPAAAEARRRRRRAARRRAALDPARRRCLSPASALYAIARPPGPVLLLFLTAAVIALILNPLVSAVQRARVPRGLAILVVYAGFFATLALVGTLLANPIAEQFSTFRDDVPSIVRSANGRLDDVQDYFDRKNINIEVTAQGQTALQTLQKRVVGGTDQVVSLRHRPRHPLVTAGFGVILVFVLSVYMLVYGERIGDLARSRDAARRRVQDDDFPTRVSRAVAGYVRGQLLFSVAMGVGAGVGLYLLGLLGIFPDGKTYALGFGAFFGLMELIPYVGPFLGAAAARARGAVPGPDHRACGSACCSSPSSRSRATSSRRSCSARHCGSTRCSSSSRCCSAARCSASSARCSRSRRRP